MKLSYPQRQIIKHGSVILLVIILIVVIEYFSVRNIYAQHALKKGFWGSNEEMQKGIILFFGIFIGMLIVYLQKKFDKFLDTHILKTNNALKGLKGENIVDAELEKLLDSDEYKVYRNFELLESAYDIDFVIVNREGIILLDVKNWNAKYHFKYDKVSYFNEKNGNEIILNEKSDPRYRLSQYEEDMRKALSENGLNNIKIRKILLYINSESADLEDNGENIYKVFIVKGIDRLKKYFDEYKHAYVKNDCKKQITDILNQY